MNLGIYSHKILQEDYPYESYCIGLLKINSNMDKNYHITYKYIIISDSKIYELIREFYDSEEYSFLKETDFEVLTKEIEENKKIRIYNIQGNVSSINVNYLLNKIPYDKYILLKVDRHKKEDFINEIKKRIF